LRHLLRALKQPLTAERLHTAVDDEIQAYDAYLRDVCGAAAHTRVHRTRHVQAFLTSVFGEGPVCVETLRPTCFAAFLITRARTCRPGTVGVIADGLRSYVRYLRLAGRATPGLGEAIPTAARWRLASLPVHLTPPEVDRFLRGFHQRTSRNRRDYAMALCLVHLGLRAAEVANLRLPDVDWHAGSLTIRATKTHRARNLPLVLPVGRALVRYLRARPATTCDHVFVRIGARAGDPLVPSVVRSAARQGYHRAGLPAHYTGTHRLRHTAATRLIAAGASIKDVADVLGHVSIDSTAIYAKVDLARLRAVALPWTEVAR
jgi:integrase